MILRSVWLRNNTASPLEFLGIEIAPNSQEDFSYESDLDLQTDDTLVAALLSGSISIGDGTVFKPVSEAINGVLYPPITPSLIANGTVAPQLSPQLLYRVNGNQSQNVPHYSETTLLFSSLTREDNAFIYDLSTGKITITSDGWFKILSIITMDNIREHEHTEVHVYVNNTRINGSSTTISSSDKHVSATATVQAMLHIVAGDVVEIRVRSVNSRRPSRRSQTQKTVKNSCNILIERV